jgi:hypothetical protein
MLLAWRVIMLRMVWSSEFPRRRFLAAMAAAPAMPAGIIPAQPDVPGTDVSADIGSLYGTILEATAPAEYPMSLLAVQPSEFGLQQRRIRQKTLELFLYRPGPADPSPKILGRWEGAHWVQEKVEFATAPWFRVSGYVLSPKGFPGRRPAVVDLHSHGGMYLFGKEKVMPMPGGDHPAIVRYRKDNYDGFSTSLELCRRGYVVVSIDAFYFGERRTAFQDAGGLALRDRDSLTVEEVDALNRRPWPGLCSGREPPGRGLCIGMTCGPWIIWCSARTWTPPESAVSAFPWEPTGSTIWLPWMSGLPARFR